MSGRTSLEIGASAARLLGAPVVPDKQPASPDANVAVPEPGTFGLLAMPRGSLPLSGDGSSLAGYDSPVIEFRPGIDELPGHQGHVSHRTG